MTFTSSPKATWCVDKKPKNRHTSTHYQHYLYHYDDHYDDHFHY